MSIHSSFTALLILLSFVGLSKRCFSPSTAPSLISTTGTPGTVRLNLLGFPLGLSLKEGALGLGRFLARPPM